LSVALGYDFTRGTRLLAVKFLLLSSTQPKFCVIILDNKAAKALDFSATKSVTTNFCL
jgi:hypothetical protein